MRKMLLTNDLLFLSKVGGNPVFTGYDARIRAESTNIRDILRLKEKLLDKKEK